MSELVSCSSMSRMTPAAPGDFRCWALFQLGGKKQGRAPFVNAVGAIAFLSILLRCVLHWTGDSIQFFERLT